MSLPIAAVVVGAGLMGRWHAHAIRVVGGKLVGVVDTDAARAAALARSYGGCRSFTRLAEALVASPAFVHVCTPLDSHVALVHTALEAGAHVIAEKPMAPTATDTRALLELAAKMGKLLVPVHQFPWQEGIRTLLGGLSRLEPIVHLDIATASAGTDGRPADCADHVAGEILPHFLSLTRRLLGGPLPEQDWSVSRPRAGEWRVSGRAGTTSIAYLVSMAARPTFAELRMLGERGSARADLFHGYAIFEGGGVSRARKIARPFRTAAQSLIAASLGLASRAVRREPAYPGLAELIRQAYMASMHKSSSPVSPEEALDVARMRDVLLALGTASR
jgi:predicted dehydrogenase